MKCSTFSRHSALERGAQALPCTLRSALCVRRCRSERGTALIETAIMLPLYMLILLGLIYFGYAGMSKQRQATATAYAAWLPGGAPADQLLNEFWPWAGQAQGTAVQARAGDTTLTVPEERVRTGDEYYGNVIPSQLVGGAHSLGGGGNDVFDTERVTVELWNYALGHTVQSFNWVPGQGVVQQMNTNYDDFSRYLNPNASPTGFVSADAGDPPQIGRYQTLMTQTCDGPPGAQWLQRRTATTLATYQPPFFPQVFSDGTAPPTTFGNYISGNYPPVTAPTSKQQFDVTGRNPDVFRRAVGENGQTSASLLTEAGNLLGGALPPPDAMDGQSLGASGKTMQQAWTAW